MQKYARAITKRAAIANDNETIADRTTTIFMTSHYKNLRSHLQRNAIAKPKEERKRRRNKLKDKAEEEERRRDELKVARNTREKR
jgi:hypothetical protein